MEQPQHDARTSGDGWSYAKFVRDNPTSARTLEALLQYAGFFAPARFAERDLSIESGYALSSLAALAHDQILLRGRGSLDHWGQHREAACSGGADENHLHVDVRAPGSSIRLDLKRGEKTSSMAVVAERMRVGLAVIAHIQVVVEKLAGQHGGPRRRRQAIIYLETLKALSRLLLLACTREMVIGGGSYVSGEKRRSPRCRNPSKPRGDGTLREVDLTGVRSGHAPSSECAGAAAADRPDSPSRPPLEVYTGKRSGVRLIIPPRANVVWTGRGRSNRSIGVGRVSTASSPSCDGSRCSQGSADGEICGASRLPADGSSRGFANWHGVQGRGTGRSNEATNAHVSCVGPQPRRQELHASEPGGGGEGSEAWLLAGEVIHILRPLVYSYGCGSAGERSWRPWLTSLGMDVAAFACTARAGGNGAVSLLIPIGPAGSSGVPVLPYLDEEQAAELRRRKMLWFLYLMRSPAFELLGEPVSRGAAGVFEGVPVLGGMASYALNMLLYVQRHHFYTSAS